MGKQQKKDLISITPEVHLALEKFKEKLKEEYKDSFSYSDIIIVGLRIMWDLLFGEKDERIYTMLKNAKEYRLLKRKGEIPHLTIEESTKKLLQDVLPKQNFVKAEELKKDILRGIIKRLILQYIEENKFADVLSLLMQYSHLFDENDLKEIRDEMLKVGMIEQVKKLKKTEEEIQDIKKTVEEQ